MVDIHPNIVNLSPTPQCKWVLTSMCYYQKGCRELVIKGQTRWPYAYRPRRMFDRLLPSSPAQATPVQLTSSFNLTSTRT